jgi:hypothetical protein
MHKGSGEDSIERGALRSKLFNKYHSGYQVEKNEISKACSMYWEEERWVHVFGGKPLKEESTWKTKVARGSLWNCDRLHSLGQSVRTVKYGRGQFVELWWAA